VLFGNRQAWGREAGIFPDEGGIKKGDRRGRLFVCSQKLHYFI